MIDEELDGSASGTAASKDNELDFTKLDLDESNADAQIDDQMFMELVPKSVRPRVNKLKELHNKRDALLQEYLKERAELELKFSKLIKPLYEERRDIIAGLHDDTIADDTIADGKEKSGVVEDVSEEEEEDEDTDALFKADAKGVPAFWSVAISHIDVVAGMMSPEDVESLDYLTDITNEDFADGTGFELTYHFSDNPFFTNRTLTKRYEVPNLFTEDEPILQNVVGTTINWKPGMSLTHREVQQKQRKKSTGEIRTVTKTVKKESFYHFFDPPKLPDLNDVVDEAEVNEVENSFEQDYDVAQAFRSHIIPKAVLWFTGEAMVDGMLNEESQDEEVGGMMGGTPGSFTFAPPTNALFPPYEKNT
ncbi:hypothetical protein THAOC_34678 [Thalassiosira oceanica]|uniref:Nucleosome assembly protein n=1 Tax=Thalassiosira oceanica TaxID=159749 RepID=K0R324_THAOC|nr:hypothetical protein THAOC_34678 [Thalassiosira oceanica]|mmetsp:Transcript_20706/g.48635  ORF Transcript_20706/g.48635 Transcript_20706/m.48635 type:complete len:364 (-) Transcript_20706:92-1183(-)|eukprot:EJK46640.1 hypothetical protein THAOC_34678 [Thalassiosira oceanica]